MNATCPRCETTILASRQAKRLDCPTCLIRYCPHCQDWKKSGQKYCQNCGANFSLPPSAIHASVKQSAVLAVLIVVLGSFLYPAWSPWYALLYSIIALEIYFAVYLLRFQRSTRLVQASRREAFAVVRQGVIGGCLAYFMLRSGQTDALLMVGAGVLATAGLSVLILDRFNPLVIAEVRARRATWKAISAMSATEALLMRFPADR